MNLIKEFEDLYDSFIQSDKGLELLKIEGIAVITSYSIHYTKLYDKKSFPRTHVELYHEPQSTGLLWSFACLAFRCLRCQGACSHSNSVSIPNSPTPYRHSHRHRHRHSHSSYNFV